MRVAIVIAFLVALGTTACTVKSPQNMADLPVDTNTDTSTAATTFGERYDAATEEVVATDTLKAWRVAVKHAKPAAGQSEEDWKKQRDEDEKESMRQLQDLKERFPKSSTVDFMMGQVEDHFGKHEEATKHFRSSTENNTHNSMYLFKLAMSERKAGQLDKAIADFRQILKQNEHEDFARVELARTLLEKDPKSAEAKELLQTVLKKDPENKDAKELLK